MITEFQVAHNRKGELFAFDCLDRISNNRCRRAVIPLFLLGRLIISGTLEGLLTVKKLKDYMKVSVTLFIGLLCIMKDQRDFNLVPVMAYGFLLHV